MTDEFAQGGGKSQGFVVGRDNHREIERRREVKACLLCLGNWKGEGKRRRRRGERAAALGGEWRRTRRGGARRLMICMKKRTRERQEQKRGGEQTEGKTASRRR